MFRNWISSRCRTAHGFSIASQSVSQSVGRSLLLLLHPVSNRCCGLWEGMGGTFRPNTFFPCSLTHSLQFRLRRSRHCGHEYITNELVPRCVPLLPLSHRGTAARPATYSLPFARSSFRYFCLGHVCFGVLGRGRRNAGNLTGAAFRAALKYFVFVPNNTGSAKK